jgi:hypothetical protein
MKGTPTSCGRRIHAAVILHNYLRSVDIAVQPKVPYIHPGLVDRETEEDGVMRIEPGEWRVDSSTASSQSAARLQGGPNRAKTSAKEIRDHFADFFSSDFGSVPWQLKIVEKGLI